MTAPTPHARIGELEAIVAQQREQMAALLERNVLLGARVQELEAQLAKDRHNSGKPPSSDGLARKTKRPRRRSGKKAGGQLGHRGETRHVVATAEADAVVEQRPAIRTGCQAALDADAPVVGRERRQVHELPPLRLVVREDQALHVRCPACQAVTIGVFPADAPSRVQYGPRLRALVVYLVEQQLVPYGRVREVLADLFGVRLSLGTLVAWVRQGSRVLVPVEARITAALGRAPVLHSDETGVRQAGGLAWAHVACTARLTHDAIHARRGREATDAMGLVWPLAGRPGRERPRRLEALPRQHALPSCALQHPPSRAR